MAVPVINRPTLDYQRALPRCGKAPGLDKLQVAVRVFLGSLMRGTGA